MIQAIVEGHGEVQALPVLLRRLVQEPGCHADLVGGRPILQTRTQVVREADFKRALQLARFKPGVSAVLVLFDADDDCARDHVPDMRRWSQEVLPEMPCAVVMARREYEAWFLAAVESLRGQRGIRPDAAYPQEPEAKRDAKGVLSGFMPKNAPYTETTDQAALSATFSLSHAYRRAASFRHLVKDVCGLRTALGQQPTVPPHWGT